MVIFFTTLKILLEVIASERGLRFIPREIIITKREVVRMGDRYIIYLPQDQNEVWEEIKRQGKKVRIYVEVIG